MNQLSSPQHIHPHAQEGDQLRATVLLREVGFEHAFEGVEFGEHGEEQGIQIASDVAAILGADHVNAGIVGRDDARGCLLFHIYEFDGFLGVAVRELGGHDIINVISCDIRNVQCVQSFEDLLNLDVSEMSGLIVGSWGNRRTCAAVSFSFSASALGDCFELSVLNMDMKAPLESGRGCNSVTVSNAARLESCTVPGRVPNVPSIFWQTQNAQSAITYLIAARNRCDWPRGI